MIVTMFSAVLTGASRAADVSTFVRKGAKVGVWGNMCRQLMCVENVCLTLQYADGQAARAKVSSESTFYSDEDVEVVGRYCTKSLTRTYFMTYSVSVEPLDGDLYAIYTPNPIDGK